MDLLEKLTMMEYGWDYLREFHNRNGEIAKRYKYSIDITSFKDAFLATSGFKESVSKSKEIPPRFNWPNFVSVWEENREEFLKWIVNGDLSSVRKDGSDREFCIRDYVSRVHAKEKKYLEAALRESQKRSEENERRLNALRKRWRYMVCPEAPQAKPRARQGFDSSSKKSSTDRSK